MPGPVDIPPPAPRPVDTLRAAVAGAKEKLPGVREQRKEAIHKFIDGARERAKHAGDLIPAAVKDNAKRVGDVAKNAWDIAEVAKIAIADKPTRDEILKSTGQLVGEGVTSATKAAREAGTKFKTKAGAAIENAQVIIGEKAVWARENIADPAIARVQAMSKKDVFVAGAATGAAGTLIAERTLGGPLTQLVTGVGSRLSEIRPPQIDWATILPRIEPVQAVPYAPIVRPEVGGAPAPTLPDLGRAVTEYTQYFRVPEAPQIPQVDIQRIIERINPLVPTTIDPRIQQTLTELTGTYGPYALAATGVAGTVAAGYYGARYVGEHYGPQMRQGLYDFGTRVGERVTPIATGIASGITQAIEAGQQVKEFVQTAPGRVGEAAKQKLYATGTALGEKVTPIAENLARGVTQTTEFIQTAPGRAGEAARQKLYETGTAISEKVTPIAMEIERGVHEATTQLATLEARARERLNQLPTEIADAINRQVDYLSAYVSLEKARLGMIAVNLATGVEGGVGSGLTGTGTTVEEIGRVLRENGQALHADAMDKRVRYAGKLEAAAATLRARGGNV